MPYGNPRYGRKKEKEKGAGPEKHGQMLRAKKMKRKQKKNAELPRRHKKKSVA